MVITTGSIFSSSVVVTASSDFISSVSAAIIVFSTSTVSGSVSATITSVFVSFTVVSFGISTTASQEAQKLEATWKLSIFWFEVR